MVTTTFSEFHSAFSLMLPGKRAIPDGRKNRVLVPNVKMAEKPFL